MNFLSAKYFDTNNANYIAAVESDKLLYFFKITLEEILVFFLIIHRGINIHIFEGDSSLIMLLQSLQTHWHVPISGFIIYLLRKML